MRIYAENVVSILDAIYEKASEKGLQHFLKDDELKNYQNLLKEIASTSKYQEGEEILPSDLEKIKTSVKGIIESAGNELSSIEVDKEKQANYNSFEKMIALSDFLFATAMKELGCPDIPSHFGKDVENALKDTAKNVNKQVKSEALGGVNREEHYNRQRYIDAADVRKSNEELLSSCFHKTANSLQIAQLTAEYQALHKRQQGHGAWWRFFHKKENIARKELLKEMKDTIQGLVGNVDLIENSPQDIANIADGRKIEAESVKPFKEEAIVDRNNLSWKMFSYEPRNSDRANLEREEMKNRSSLNLKEKDLDGKNAPDALAKDDEKQKTISEIKNIAGLDDKQAEAIVNELNEGYTELREELKENALSPISYIDCVMRPFEEAFKFLKDGGASNKDAAIKAQNVVNHLIKNTAPSDLFTEEDVEKYSNDYVIKDDIALRVALKDLVEGEEINKLAGELKAERSKERLNLDKVINEPKNEEKAPVVDEEKNLKNAILID